MRISDWSSDVCSSDLAGLAAGPLQDRLARSAQALDARWQQWFDQPLELPEARELVNDTRKNGRASCRERVCQYVSISVVAVSVKKKKKKIQLNSDIVIQNTCIQTEYTIGKTYP